MLELGGAQMRELVTRIANRGNKNGDEFISSSTDVSLSGENKQI